MKILLLGGTGAMGVHLATILSQSSNDVRVTSRTERTSQQNITYFKGDAKDMTFLHTVLKQHWDAIVDFMVYSETEFNQRVEMLLNATSQYVFLSSARVYSNSQDPLTEESPRLLDVCTDAEYLATDEYALSKARQEDMLIFSEHYNWTIIRPYITYSESRLQLGTLEKDKWLYRALQGRTIVFAEDMLERRTTLTYGKDVAQVIASLIGNPRALREKFHITSNNSCKWSKVLEIYLDILEQALGKRPKVHFQKLPAFLSWYPGKYQVLYDRLFERRFSTVKIEQEFDAKQFTEVENGLRHCLETFLKKPEFGAISWRYEAIQNRFTKENIPLKEIRSLKQKI